MASRDYEAEREQRRRHWGDGVYDGWRGFVPDSDDPDYMRGYKEMRPERSRRESEPEAECPELTYPEPVHPEPEGPEEKDGGSQ